MSQIANGSNYRPAYVSAAERDHLDRVEDLLRSLPALLRLLVMHLDAQGGHALGFAALSFGAVLSW